MTPAVSEPANSTMHKTADQPFNAFLGTALNELLTQDAANSSQSRVVGLCQRCAETVPAYQQITDFSTYWRIAFTDISAV